MWALVSLGGVVPSQIVSVSAYLPLHHKVQKFSSGTSSPGWSQKKGRKMVVVVVLCINSIVMFIICLWKCATVITLYLKGLVGEK